MAITLDRTRKFAKAKGLGIDGYRSMTDAQLDAAIAKASKPAPAKGKTATKVSAAPAKGKTAATAKGKTTTAPAAKSTARKSTPRASAVKGKATRQSGSTQTAPVKATTRKPAAKAPVKRTTRATAAPANGTRRAPISKDKGTRVFLDKKNIDWKAESTIGLSGKRKDVLDALRRYKGNYEKVFDLLAPKARSYYKGKTKAEAESLLRWLIARVAFDFAVNTEQHEMGARRAYGTANGNGGASKSAAKKAVDNAVKRTSKPAAAKKPAATKKPVAKPKAAPAARKPVQTRTARPAAKRGGKVTAGRR